MIAACSSFGARSRHAAVVAASDPWSWVPLAGAAAIVVTNSDERISDWAKRDTPLFGSREAAIAASDRFRRYASNSAWAIFLTAPQQHDASWLAEKGVDASGNLLGLAFARGTTGMLKHATQRQRPNGNPVRDSFPSAHTSDAFAHATLARSYADDPGLNRPLREGMHLASNGFAFATAWGRVEGGAHYPSDVLMGAALANFTSRFLVKLATTNTKFDWRVRTHTDERGRIILEFAKPL